jgi:hypothetical protein
MPSAWIAHVKKYAKDNNIEYGEALKKASATFKKGTSDAVSSMMGKSKKRMGKSKKNRSRKNRSSRKRR